ncbi:MAG: DUF371 domain-containing protein [Thermoprotei archaeon]|nr:MAG: DUF371 domain-containing protein [Thermoprotei archaeon]
MRTAEVFKARGHPNVKATHRSTLEITKDPYLSPRGDCIVAIAAEKAARDLSLEFKKLASREGSVITLMIEAEGLSDVVRGYGSAMMVFNDERSIVFRKSSYICGRTVMVKADKAAADLDRRLVELLKDPSVEVMVIIEAESVG